MSTGVCPLSSHLISENSWNRVHIHHVISLRGHNWLVTLDAFSQYPCTHTMSSIFTKTTTKTAIRTLGEDFARFGYHHANMFDKANPFLTCASSWTSSTA
ncbi:transposon tf2-9 polyprotein [Plakobranchus ocellatus]|uniref:Transposon tf2-9 polyprotein n=1 Tax=Plakobranchus ocellatus TaxID=259542 RepID=A0AAV3YXE0_9GAST|nr:transposon tf2-9 polyprotein [Plakobranchus ocellatus]